jgi:uncharacterized membrane protein YwaF
MKRLAIALFNCLLVSIVLLLVLAGLGWAYGSYVGTSAIAASCVMLLVAWPWALPQIFLAVCLIWFVTQRIRSRIAN